MTLTLLALFMIPLLLKTVIDPGGTYKILKDWSNSPTLQFGATVASMMMALLIFTTSTPHFAWTWDSLLTWIAVVSAIKGIAQLFPSLVKWNLKFLKEERMPMLGFVGLLFALGLIYVNTQLI